MEDNGGKLKKLEKGSARVSPNVVFLQPTDADGSNSILYVMFLYTRVWQVNQVKKDSPCCWEVFGPQTSTSSCCSWTATGAFWDKCCELLIQDFRGCCVGNFGSVYSSTIYQPNSCWNVVGYFVCNNTLENKYCRLPKSWPMISWYTDTVGKHHRSLAPCRMASPRLEVTGFAFQMRCCWVLPPKLQSDKNLENSKTVSLWVWTKNRTQKSRHKKMQHRSFPTEV